MQFKKNYPAAVYKRAGGENQKELQHVLEVEMLGKQKKWQGWQRNEAHIQVRVQDEDLQVMQRKEVKLRK